MKIYFLSGLGADSRAFKFLNLPSSYELVFIEWLLPEKKETLIKYAERISKKIDDSKPFVLVGLSFGGILATEILRFINPAMTILISSITRKQEIPKYYKVAGFFKLNKLFPAKFANKPNAFTFWLFGVTKNQDKKLLEEILTSTNTGFSKWAVNEIINWKRNISPPGILRIHGDNDRVLPIKKFQPKYIINKGGHFMIVNRAEEISKILTMEIGDLLTNGLTRVGA